MSDADAFFWAFVIAGPAIIGLGAIFAELWRCKK